MNDWYLTIHNCENKHKHGGLNISIEFDFSSLVDQLKCVPQNLQEKQKRQHMWLMLSLALSIAMDTISPKLCRTEAATSNEIYDLRDHQESKHTGVSINGNPIAGWFFVKKSIQSG